MEMIEAILVAILVSVAVCVAYFALRAFNDELEETGFDRRND